MYKQNIIDIVISKDTDFLIYGVKDLILGFEKDNYIWYNLEKFFNHN